MKESLTKKFSVLFSLLVILQQFNIVITKQLEYGETTLISEKDVQNIYKSHVKRNHIYQSKAKNSGISQSNFRRHYRHDTEPSEIRKDKVDSKRAAGAISIALVQFLSVSMLVTGVLTGVLGGQCGKQHKNLKKNIKKSIELRQEAINLKEKINLDWQKVLSHQRYFERLASSMDVLKQQVETIKTLEEDIILLIDPNIMEKLKEKENQLKEAILKANKTKLADTKKLEEEFFDGETIGKTLFSLKTVAWFGAMGVHWSIKNSAKQVNRRAAVNWLGRNNKVAVAAVRQNSAAGAAAATTKGFFKSQNQLTNYLKTFPTFSAIQTRLTTPKMQKVFRVVKIGMKGLAVGALLALTSAFEIYRLWRNMKDCDRLEKESFVVLNKTQLTVDKLTILEEKKNNFDKNVISNYSSIYAKIKSEEFLNFIKEERKVAKDNKNKILAPAISKMDKFVESIDNTSYNDTESNERRYNFAKVESIVNGLVEAFTVIATSLKCYRDRISLFAVAKASCARGVGTKGYLFMRAKEHGKKILANCPAEIKKEIDYSSFVLSVDGLLKVDNKRSVCVQNNLNIQALVCNSKRNGIKEHHIANSLDTVTLQDVQYFMDICPLKDVNQVIANAICYQKSLGKSLDDVIKSVQGYKESQIKDKYGKCSLNKFQLQYICNERENNAPLEVVKASMKHYPGNLIETTYNSCQLVITPLQESFICALVVSRKIKDVKHSALNQFTKKFGANAVSNIMKNKCPFYNYK